MNFFISLVGMSVQASVVIGVVLLLRLFFSKLNISKKYVMLLWMIPFVCLIIPWKINSPVGFWSSSPAEYKYENMILPRENPTNHGAEVKNTNIDVWTDNELHINENANNHSNINTNVNSQTKMAESTLEQGVTVAMVVWGIVTAVLYLYSIISYVRLKRQLCKRIPIRQNIYLVDDIAVPMVVGIMKPTIYIPSGIEPEHMKYVIAHEKTHIRRKDIVVKLASYGITCLHWFNPLVWLSYHLMVKDMEMACDEETISRLGQEKKKEYATALLQLSTGKRNIFAVPLAFGEGSTKERIKNILKYKKTKHILVVAALVIGAFVAIVFLSKDDSAVGESVEGTEVSETIDTTEVEETIAEEEETIAGEETEQIEDKEQETSIEEENTIDKTEEKIEDSQVMEATETSEGTEPAQEEEVETLANESNELDETQLEWFRSSFFNNEENYMTNMFLTSEYDRPTEINLFNLFYNGTGNDTNYDISQEEIQMLTEIDEYAMDLDKVKIPAQEMETVLQRYMNISFEETAKTGLEGLCYLEEYQSYYNLAGDSLRGLYNILSGQVNEDGTITIQYCAEEGGSDTVYQVTLREDNGNYYFISNKSVE